MYDSSNFVDWWVVMREKLSICENHNEILKIIENEAISLGFNNFAYAVRTTAPFTRPKTHILGNYPNEWVERYQAKNYGSHDPSIERSVRLKQLVVWDKNLHTENPQLFSEANDWGLKYGVTLTTRGVDNTLQVLSFSRNYGVITKKEEPILNLKLKCLLDLTHEKMCHVNTYHFGRVEIILSPREKEILQWTADGKSASEISLILGITVHTVNFHLKNLQQKLDANNKTASAARAVALGLI